MSNQKLKMLTIEQERHDHVDEHEHGEEGVQVHVPAVAPLHILVFGPSQVPVRDKPGQL